MSWLSENLCKLLTSAINPIAEVANAIHLPFLLFSLNGAFKSAFAAPASFVVFGIEECSKAICYLTQAHQDFKDEKDCEGNLQVGQSVAAFVSGTAAEILFFGSFALEIFTVPFAATLVLNTVIHGIRACKSFGERTDQNSNFSYSELFKHICNTLSTGGTCFSILAALMCENKKMFLLGGITSTATGFVTCVSLACKKGFFSCKTTKTDENLMIDTYQQTQHNYGSAQLPEPVLPPKYNEPSILDSGVDAEDQATKGNRLPAFIHMNMSCQML